MSPNRKVEVPGAHHEVLEELKSHIQGHEGNTEISICRRSSPPGLEGLGG